MHQHITEVIQEAVQRRVSKTIQDYADKNRPAFAANKIAGIQWKLDLNVLVDNLGLLPAQTPRPSFLKRILDALKTLFQTKRP